MRDNNEVYLGKYRGFLRDYGLDSISWHVFYDAYENHLGEKVTYVEDDCIINLYGETVSVSDPGVARALAENLLSYAEAVDKAKLIVKEKNEEQV